MIQNDFFFNYAKEYDQTIANFNSLDDWVFTKNLPSNHQKVLEIGCGPGKLLKLMTNYFDECYGIDISPAMIKLAKSKDKYLKVTCTDAHRLPFKDGYFNYVISHTTFHHLDRKKAILEAERVLRKEGKLVIVDITQEASPWKKRADKIIRRYFLTAIRILIKFGPKKTVDTYRFVNHPSWRKHVQDEKPFRFSRKKFREFYGKLLPGAKFGSANYLIEYLVWTKN